MLYQGVRFALCERLPYNYARTPISHTEPSRQFQPVGLKVRDDDGSVTTITAKELAAMQKEPGDVITTLQAVGYITLPIEVLKEGDYVVSRDQHDPTGALLAVQITRKYERIADHLEIVGIQDSNGISQTLFTTDEHPFHVPAKSWTKSRLLETGDGLTGPTEIGSTVTSNARQSHIEGVKVYNMEVKGTHTYFVRAQGSEAEPVWVHNAGYAGTGPRTDNRFGHNRRIREVARSVEANGETVVAGGRAFDGKYRPEMIIETPGGFKGTRRPDLIVERVDGSKYGINVGRVDASGRPVLRERLAIQDLNEQAGLEMQFVSYGGRH